MGFLPPPATTIVLITYLPEVRPSRHTNTDTAAKVFIAVSFVKVTIDKNCSLVTKSGGSAVNGPFYRRGCQLRIDNVALFNLHTRGGNHMPYIKSRENVTKIYFSTLCYIISLNIEPTEISCYTETSKTGS